MMSTIAMEWGSIKATNLTSLHSQCEINFIQQGAARDA